MGYEAQLEPGSVA